MANGRIAINPALLMSQSAEMLKLTEDYDHLLGSVSSSLTTMNTRWSANLSNNFAAKIKSAGSSFSFLKRLLTGGASVARTSAERFLSVDQAFEGLKGLAAHKGGGDYPRRSQPLPNGDETGESVSLYDYLFGRGKRRAEEIARKAGEIRKDTEDKINEAVEEVERDHREHSVIVNENPDYQHQWDAQHFYITPPKENHQGYRYPEAYMEVMRSLNVEGNTRYQNIYNPFWGFSSTCCNVYVWDVLTAMDCKLPSVDYFGCAQMRDWMASPAGQEAGWVSVDRETAIAMANQGYPTVAADTAGGHVAMVAPQQNGDSGLYLSQAGAHNMTYGRFVDGWGSGYDQDSDIRYFYHK